MSIRPGVTSKAVLDGTYAPLTLPVLTSAGRVWTFIGDSITNRSAAAAGRGFADYVPHLVGTSYMAPVPPLTPATGATYSATAGVPGERSDQILARLPAVLAAGAQGVVWLAGTNDASQAVSTATFLGNVQAAALLCKKAGVPMVVGTVPPRSTATTAAIRTAIAGYNMALRAWAASAGVFLADVFGSVVDVSSGSLAAAYDSGDGTHPNTAGHRKIAEAFAVAIRRTFVAESPLVSAKSIASLIPNPMFDTNTTGWFEQPGGTGTAPTYSRVADTTGRLPTGALWYEQDFDATASGGTRTFAIALSGTYASGDLLLVTGQLDLIDVNGYVTAANADPNTAAVKYGVTSGGSFLASTAQPPPLGQSPGEIALPVTATASSGLVLWCTVTLPTGAHLKTRLSCADVRNLTTLAVTGF